MMELLDAIVQSVIAAGPVAIIGALACCMFLNSVVMAPPSEYIGIFAGIYAASHSLTFLFELAGLLALANLAGTTLWYFLGLNRSRAGKDFLPNWLTKWWPNLITQLYVGQLPKLLESFQRAENFSLLLFRNVPVVRSIVSYPAGYARVSPQSFFLLSGIGIFVWTSLWMLLGFEIGKVAYTYKTSVGILAATIVVVVYLLLRMSLARCEQPHN